MTVTAEAREAVVRCVAQFTGWSEQSAARIADRIVALPEIAGPLAASAMAASDREQFPDDG